MPGTKTDMQTILLAELLKRFEGQFGFDYSRVPSVRWQDLEITDSTSASSVLSNAWKVVYEDKEHPETQVIYEVLEINAKADFSLPVLTRNTGIRLPTLYSDDEGPKIQLKGYGYFTDDKVWLFEAEALTERNESIHVVLTEPVPKGMRVGSSDDKSRAPGRYSFGFTIYEHISFPHQEPILRRILKSLRIWCRMPLGISGSFK